MRNNIPIEKAMTMSAAVRRAACIVFAEMDGGRFNWSTWQFEEPK